MRSSLQLTAGGGNPQACFPDGLAQYGITSWKELSRALLCSSSKGQWGSEILPVGITLTTVLGGSFCVRKTWLGYGYVWSPRQWWVAWLVVQGPGTGVTGELETRNSAEVRRWTYANGNMKNGVLGSNLNVHQRTFLVDAYQHLFSHIPVGFQWIHEWNSHESKKMEATPESLPLTKIWLIELPLILAVALDFWLSLLFSFTINLLERWVYFGWPSFLGVNHPPTP